jgi:hypothetical protein
LHKARWQVKRLAITRGLSPCLSLLLRKVRWQVKRLAITRWLSPRLSRLNKELWRVKRFSLVSRVIFFVNAIQTFASISCLRSTEVLIWWMNLMQFFNRCVALMHQPIILLNISTWCSHAGVMQPWSLNPIWSWPYLDCQTRNNNHAWHVLYYVQFSTELFKFCGSYIGFHCSVWLRSVSHLKCLIFRLFTRTINILWCSTLYSRCI